MSMGPKNEKPTRVEPGMRFELSSGEPFEVMRLVDDELRIFAVQCRDDDHEREWLETGILSRTYLGGPVSTVEERPEPAVPATPAVTLYGVDLAAFCPCGHRNGKHRPNQGGCDADGCACSRNPFSRLMAPENPKRTEAEITALMVAHDAARMAPALFPDVSNRPHRQSILRESCIGVWSLR